MLKGIAAAVAFAAALPAAASVLYETGPAVADGGYCSSNTVSCLGNGWTIYSPFALSRAARISGGSYGNGMFGLDYASTNWSLWLSDPVIVFAAGPAFSGVSVGTISAGAAGTKTVTLTGLNIPLAAGTYYLGFANNVSGGSVSSYARASTGLGPSSQSDNTGHFYNPSISPASFAVFGTAVPEPATWLLLIGGFGAIGVTARRRRSVAA